MQIGAVVKAPRLRCSNNIAEIEDDDKNEQFKVGCRSQFVLEFLIEYSRVLLNTRLI